ncbi:TonB-dependent receptor domain-containing protein [Aliikangiella sp. G2MR2-5]|uniref:TonB-dependent receptor domain-containing protein n=1 Tax=Aliikangiella sp. G2MR2-5 TaxID=2788943 RepID=UPI0018AC3944|nr:TonB-dependent receptor [Aliikangiella sp. G2MR2-5]
MINTFQFKKFIVATSILLSSSYIYADDATIDESRTLVITGSPIQQSIEGLSEQLDEYDNQVITDAGDLLIRFPGFSAIRAGGHGIDPVLRGQSQTRLNLLQQGAFLHGAGPNRMDSPGSYTEPFGWDEVQIIKGVESLIFGSGGPAGTINFKRYSPLLGENEIEGKLMVAYSPDYYKLGTDLATGNEKGYLRLISQLLDQKSYEDGEGKLTRTAFNTRTNTLIAGYTPNQDVEWRISFMANRGADALFAGTMMDGPKTDMDAIQLMYLDGDQNSNNYTEYQLYFNEAHHVMDNFSLREQTASMRMLTDSYSKTSGLKWLRRWQNANKNITWQTSFDWQNVDRHAERYMSMMGTPSILQARIWPQNELDIKGIALEAEYLFDDNNRIKSGIRYDHVSANSPALQTDAGQSLYQNYYSNTPSNSSEDNVSAFSRYFHKTNSSLYWLGVNSTVRTADATERYLGAANNMAMMRWVGNPGIKPERHNQLELGVKWRFDNGWHELSVYHDQVSNFILRDRASMGDLPDIIATDMATVYRNTDATLSGFEYAIQKSFAHSWNFYGNVAYVKGKRDSDSYPLYQIPPVEGLLQVSNESEKWAYWIDLRFAMKQDEVDDNMMQGSMLDAGKSDSWTVIDFKFRYSLSSDWQLSAGINNLFDKTFSYHVSRANMDPFNPEAIRVNEPGRHFWFSVLKEL